MFEDDEGCAGSIEMSPDDAEGASCDVVVGYDVNRREGLRNCYTHGGPSRIITSDFHGALKVGAAIARQARGFRGSQVGGNVTAQIRAVRGRRDSMLSGKLRREAGGLHHVGRVAEEASGQTD